MSPDVTSYGALVSSCEKDAEWQLALHFLREFQGFWYEKIGGKPSGGKFCVEKSGYLQVCQVFPAVNLDSKLGPPKGFSCRSRDLTFHKVFDLEGPPAKR